MAVSTLKRTTRSCRHSDVAGKHYSRSQHQHLAAMLTSASLLIPWLDVQSSWVSSRFKYFPVPCLNFRLCSNTQCTVKFLKVGFVVDHRIIWNNNSETSSVWHKDKLFKCLLGGGSGITGSSYMHQSRNRQVHMRATRSTNHITPTKKQDSTCSLMIHSVITYGRRMWAQTFQMKLLFSYTLNFL